MKTHLETILRAAPFNLDTDGISWVDECYQQMTPAEKLGQLFVLLAHGDAQSVSRVISEFQPAGICRVFTSDLNVELDVAEQARQPPSIGRVRATMIAINIWSRRSIRCRWTSGKQHLGNFIGRL